MIWFLPSIHMVRGTHKDTRTHMSASSSRPPSGESECSFFFHHTWNFPSTKTKKAKIYTHTATRTDTQRMSSSERERSRWWFRHLSSYSTSKKITKATENNHNQNTESPYHIPHTHAAPEHSNHLLYQKLSFVLPSFFFTFCFFFFFYLLLIYIFPLPVVWGGDRETHTHIHTQIQE